MNVLFSVLVAFFFVSAGWAQGGYSDDVFMFYSAPDQLSEGEMQDQILLNESFPEELETLFRLQPESKAVDWTRFGGTSEHRPFTCVCTGILPDSSARDAFRVVGVEAFSHAVYGRARRMCEELERSYRSTPYVVSREDARFVAPLSCFVVTDQEKLTQ